MAKSSKDQNNVKDNDGNKSNVESLSSSTPTPAPKPAPTSAPTPAPTSAPTPAPKPTRALNDPRYKNE